MARFRLERDASLEAEREKDIAFKAGFTELFAELKGKALKCALVTSSALPQVQNHFADTDYLSQFDSVNTVEKVKNGKPAPDCYRMASEQIEIAPAECLVLEDSKNGMRAGLGTDCHAVMIPDLLGPDSDVVERATAVVGSLVEIKRFL
ncbi:HAD family phosphatase [uncultured Photobacterium sp.]|uniref:HAD family hydrolase n=1 Tax=uncultured Photobacterium sp. TaxID=173973 RepID=UPI00260BA808|nr:HAD family hydrolase [uncultured Photobacterium sp.]